MKVSKLLIVLALLFSVTQTYAVTEQDDAPCTAVADSTTDQTQPATDVEPDATGTNTDANQ